jgi:hypothetical protein
MQIAIYVKFWFIYLCGSAQLHERPWPFRVRAMMPPHGVPINQKIEEKGTRQQQWNAYQIHAHNDDVALLNTTSPSISKRGMKNSPLNLVFMVTTKNMIVNFSILLQQSP